MEICKPLAGRAQAQVIWHGYGNVLKSLFLEEDHKVSESMKTIYKLTLLVFLLSFGYGTIQAQSHTEVLDRVTKVLATDNAGDQLVRYFDDRVEISLMGKRQAYSRTQAQYVISQFLADYPLGNFNLIQKGETSDTVYVTGECPIPGGKMEVNIFIKVSSGRVSEMQFERR